MFVCLLMLLIAIDTAHSCHAHSHQQLGGWQTSHDGGLQAEMVNLAQQQLNSTTNLAFESIRVLSFDTQIVAGTKLRLVFNVDEQQECTLIAFKPLPYTREPIQVTSFTCNDITVINNVTTDN